MRVGYVRISTDDQKTDLQLDALKPKKLDRIFIDIETGTTAKRREYQALLKLMGKGEISEIHFYRVDRLGRDHYELVNFLQLVELHEVYIESVTEPYVSTWNETPWAFRAMWEAIGDARYELLRLKERQRAGIEAARARGVHLGRRRKNDRKTER